MKIEIRKYKESNLIIADILSDKDKLLNILVIAYSDDKKDILLKKVLFEESSPFHNRIDFNIFDICEELVNSYGDKGDIQKLWYAKRFYDAINYND